MLKQALSGKTTDETFHLILYSVLTLIILCSISIKHHQRNVFYETIATFFVLILMFLFGLLMELCQDIFMEGRTYQVNDLIANSLGIASGALLYLIGSLTLNTALKIKLRNSDGENPAKEQLLICKIKTDCLVIVPLAMGLFLYGYTSYEDFLDIVIHPNYRREMNVSKKALELATVNEKATIVQNR